MPPVGVYCRIMPTGAVFAALLSAAIAFFLKRLVIHGWPRLRLPVASLKFPHLCPVCLSTAADTAVEEKSSDRVTANYVVARKHEWLRAPVPHCSRCADKIFRNQVIGIVVGAACSGIALVLALPPRVSLLTLCYLLFGLPAYRLAITVQKGVVLGEADATTVRVHVRRPEYRDALAALNGIDSGPSMVDLADGKGVWIRRG
jgi:hypothetical protein